MNRALLFSSTVNIVVVKGKLKWGKKNLPTDVFDKIEKSYHEIKKRTLLLLVCVILPILAVGTVISMGGNRGETVKPEHAVARRTARVGYDQNLYWTYEKKAYEIKLKECGLDTDLETGTTFYIYVGDDGHLIEVIKDDPYAEINIRLYIGIGLTIIAIVTIIIFALVVRKLKFAQPWYLFIKECDGDKNWESFCEKIRTS